MLHVGLDAWIIQDGNYGEFAAGGEYRFALEFEPCELLAEAGFHAGSHLSYVGKAVHEARGAILYRSGSAWVVDFGVPAYQEGDAPTWARVGAWVSGRVYLGVDPFIYGERLKDEPGMPNLFRQWFVRRILLTRGESFVEVAVTDAWNHDGGNGHYVLECEPARA